MSHVRARKRHPEDNREPWRWDRVVRWSALLSAWRTASRGTTLKVGSYESSSQRRVACTRMWSGGWGGEKRARDVLEVESLGLDDWLDGRSCWGERGPGGLPGFYSERDAERGGGLREGVIDSGRDCSSSTPPWPLDP